MRPTTTTLEPATPTPAARLWVTVGSALLGLAAATLLTDAWLRPGATPHGRSAAGFASFYLYPEAIELPAFLLVTLLVPLAILAGHRAWTRLGDVLIRCRTPLAEVGATAAVPFMGLLALAPSLPFVRSEPALGLGSATLIALAIFAGAALVAAARAPAPLVTLAAAIGALGGAALAGLGHGGLPASATIGLAVAAALACGSGLRRWPERSAVVVAVAAWPLIAGLGVTVVRDGGPAGFGLPPAYRLALAVWVLVVGAALAVRRLAPFRGPTAALAAALALAGASLDPRAFTAPFDPYHEGEYLAAAQELGAGGRPFADVIVMHGFGQDLLEPLAGFALFGETTSSLRRVQRLLVPLAVLAGGFTASRVLGPRGLAAWGLLVLTLGAGRMGLSDRTALAQLALGLHLWAIARPSWRRGIAAGAAAVAAAAWAFDTGGAVLLGGMLALAGWARTEVRSRRVHPLSFLGGAAAATALWVGVMAATGVLRPFVAAELDLLRHHDLAFGRPFAFALQLSPAPWFAFFAIGVVVGCLSLAVHCAVRRPLAAVDLQILLLALASAVLLKRGLDRSDFDHLVGASHSAWVPALWLAGRLASTRPRRVAAATLLAAMIFAISPVLLPGPHTAGGRLLWLAARTTEDATGRVRLDAHPRLDLDLAPAAARHLAPVLDAIRANTRPGDAILDLTNHGALLFIADRRNAIRYPQIWLATGLERQDEIAAAIARSPPAMVLYRSGIALDRLDRIDNLVRHHRVAAAVHGLAMVAYRAGDFVLLLDAASAPLEPVTGPILERLAHGFLPYVWGHDAPPGRPIAWVEAPPPVRGQPGWFEVTDPRPGFGLFLDKVGSEPPALVIRLASAHPTQATLTFRATTAAPARGGQVTFEVAAGGASDDYWVALANHPEWAASDGVWLSLAFDPPPGAIAVGPLRAVAELP